MLIDINRVTASICPECSNASMGTISIFAFSGNRPMNILCPIKGCQSLLANITPRADKFKVSVDCPFCGEVHEHSVKISAFWKSELLTFPCPRVGLSSFFIGTRGRVDKAMKETLAKYSKMYEEAMSELEDLDCGYVDDENDIIYDIADVIYEMREDGNMSCVCGSEAVSINIIGRKILLSCPRCRRTKTIDATPENLAMVLNATMIVLGK